MDYTISTQYHEKKCCYIYVVLLASKVSNTDFMSQIRLSKNYGGYYSTYKGVNGFVFKTRQDVDLFCDDLSLYSNVIEELSNVSNITFPQEDNSKQTKEPIAKVNSKDVKQNNSSESVRGEAKSYIMPPSGKMDLHNALRTIIRAEGQGIITELRIVNILDNFNAFSDMPSAKYILRAIIADGHMQKLLQIREWNNEANNLAARFIATTGFTHDVVEILFKSIAYGLGWINKWESSRPTTNPQPSPIPQPIGIRVKNWSRNMAEDDADEFFRSIVDYDDEGASKYKVSIENLHFIVDEEEDIFVSCELRKRYRKEYCVNLMYALYDSKGRLRYASNHNNTCIGYVDTTDRGLKPVTCYFTQVKASEIGKIKLYWQSPDFY